MPLALPISRRRGAASNTRTADRQKLKVPNYRVHKAKRLGYVRLDGRMIYLGRAGTAQSHERYRRIIAEWLATGRVPPRRGADEGNGVSVSEMIDRYLHWARRYYVDTAGRPSPGIGSVEAASRPLRELYGSTPAEEFGPLALRAVRQVMIDSGLCRNVVNQRVACVKRMFRWAVAEELAPPSVLTALTAVESLRKGRSGARETAPVRPVPDEHVEAVLRFLPPTLQAMVRLQRLTGMRSGELCILRSCDVDTSGDVWLYRPAHHKTSYRDHERVVRIGPSGQTILRPFLRREQSQAYVFTPSRAQWERTRSFKKERARAAESDDGKRCYNPRSYHRALRYAMRAASRAGALDAADYWHPHQLRHRHATEIRRTKGLEAARVLLGHRTLEQTLEYAEADGELASSIARELG
jgi:integrase